MFPRTNEPSWSSRKTTHRKEDRGRNDGKRATERNSSPLPATSYDRWGAGVGYLHCRRVLLAGPILSVIPVRLRVLDRTSFGRHGRGDGESTDGRPMGITDTAHARSCFANLASDGRAFHSDYFRPADSLPLGAARGGRRRSHLEIQASIHERLGLHRAHDILFRGVDYVRAPDKPLVRGAGSNWRSANCKAC